MRRKFSFTCEFEQHLAKHLQILVSRIHIGYNFRAVALKTSSYLSQLDETPRFKQPKAYQHAARGYHPAAWNDGLYSSRPIRKGTAINGMPHMQSFSYFKRQVWAVHQDPSYCRSYLPLWLLARVLCDPVLCWLLPGGKSFVSWQIIILRNISMFWLFYSSGAPTAILTWESTTNQYGYDIFNRDKICVLGNCVALTS